MHKAGFVSIIGKPNVGKSTLLNAMLGQKLSIVSPKAQTTRQRIMGIINEPEYQIVFSDTPGIIDPAYPLQEIMMNYVHQSLEDADFIILMIEPGMKEISNLEQLQALLVPLVLVINKIDTISQEELEAIFKHWSAGFDEKNIYPVSALNNFNILPLKERIIAELPDHPPFFDKEDISDKTERFIAAEIIREKIFFNYKQEIPYSTEVAITGFKEFPEIINMTAEIFVERDSQKGIIIGNKGASIKKVGTEARHELELFFNKKVFLETFVKVEPEWRKKKGKLRKFGYL